MKKKEENKQKNSTKMSDTQPTQKEIKSIADLNKVPEFLLKKRKRNVKSKHTDQRKTRAQTAVAVRQRKNPKPLNFKRLEWYVDRAPGTANKPPGEA